MKKRPSYTKEFKLEAVRLLERGDKSAADLARELGIQLKGSEPFTPGAVANPSTKFTVSLEGMAGSSTYSKVMGAVQQGIGPRATATNWEMAQLYQGGRLKDVTFMEGNKVVPNPFQ